MRRGSAGPRRGLVADFVNDAEEIIGVGGVQAVFVCACGFALLAVPGVDASYWPSFFLAIVVLGLGLAITVAPLTTSVMNSVPVADVGAASGINNAASRIAGVLAVALFGIFMVPVFDRELHDRLAGENLAPATLEVVKSQRGKLAAIELPVDLDARSRTTVERAIAQAFVVGYRWSMLMAAVWALAGAMCVWFMTRGRT